MIRTLSASRFARFLAVGALNTLFGYAAFALLVVMGVGSGMALLLATLAGMIFNYFTTGTLVFSPMRGSTHDRAVFLRFAALYASLYACNLAALKTLQHVGLPALYAQAALVLPFALISYFLNKLFVFRAPAPEGTL